MASDSGGKQKLPLGMFEGSGAQNLCDWFVPYPKHLKSKLLTAFLNLLEAEADPKPRTREPSTPKTPLSSLRLVYTGMLVVGLTISQISAGHLATGASLGFFRVQGLGFRV